MPKPFDQLLKQFLADELDPRNVPSFIKESAQQEKLLADEFEKGMYIYKGESESLNKEMLFQDVLERAKQLRPAQKPAPIGTIYKKWAVAASVLLIIGVGSYFTFFNKKKEVPPVAVIEQDVTPPVSNKARVILSDGRSVSIDSLSTIADGSVMVTKDANGSIVYTGSTDELKYNTLVNPRGSQVATTTLADGTKVWLNAGSSIKYFASNAGKERNVEISGEGYFEVAKDKQRPFIVTKGETSITVLGTHFNINAYDDEDEVKVTLLEGSVRCGIGEHTTILKPGQQAVIAYRISRLKVNSDVDVEEVMAWKNGKFNFGEQASIETIMKQLERWYDIETKYEGKVNVLFGGSMPRSINISEVLKKIEKTGGVRFTIEGRTIIVEP